MKQSMRTKSITERLESIKIAKGRTILCKLREIAYTKPLKSDIEEIPGLYARFQAVSDPACKDNVKIFVLLIFFVYDPVSLVSKRMLRGKVRKELGEVLGISGSAVTRHFADAKSLFNHHKGFKEEAERIFSALHTG